MRYSMLVYLTDMCKTLGEAERYLQAAPGSAVHQEILEHGVQMVAQIQGVVQQHREELRSSLVLEQLEALAARWEQAGKDPDLGALLEDIPHTLVREMDHQVRAVFFAELGEKWDSMASVYEFMRDDPRFDPVVVLTPVFRQVKKNGEDVQEVIYKDHLTDMGIPFLPFDQYDLEQDCPELAFISQPYESVTLQQFWPETIAKTTRLVYLPYYLPSHIFAASLAALCQMPVYDHAWKVIGSTEKHYQFYCKHSRQKGKNMLLTGLPKLDPLVTLAERGVPLPDGWEKIQGKKVFLWNTWYDVNISSLKYFDAILNWFDAHPDCVLIWRPHPMMDTVTKLYYPERYPKFKAYLHKIQVGPNSILDEETSCEAAFYYSDAQLSDYSSLMVQYLLMDKPLLWIKRSAESAPSEKLIGDQWIEQTFDLNGVIDFLERIYQDDDRKAELRKKAREEDLPLADGNAGARVCECLWTALHQEDGVGD